MVEFDEQEDEKYSWIQILKNACTRLPSELVFEFKSD